MRADQARTISISSYLQFVEGINPDKERMNGRELWYRSPIRTSDNTPSFKVDTHLNLWYDHGSLSGGNTLDLVIAIRNCTVSEALKILESSGLYHGGYSPSALKTNTQKQLPSQKISSAVEKEKSVALQIIAVDALENSSLMHYLQSRGIDTQIAKKYVKQVRFKPHNKLAEYFGVGFKSGDGYEIRNKYFKGFAGSNKNIEIINPQEAGELVLFEGFMDFLSYLTYLKQHKNITDISVSVAVMNSVTMKNQLIEKIKYYKFTKIYSFLDNDDAGRIAFDSLEIALPDTVIIDKSEIFAPHKDFNDFLMSKI